jgi:hypothetical protein
MAKIVDLTNNLDRTLRIYDQFYSYNSIVNPDEFDVVNGYFLSVCDTKSVAGNFTASIFRISQTTGIPALSLLEQIKGANNKLEMNKIICYFLNTLKNKSALYGVAQIPRPNQSVSRNILQ